MRTNVWKMSTSFSNVVKNSGNTLSKLLPKLAKNFGKCDKFQKTPVQEKLLMLDKPELDRKSGNGCWEESVQYHIMQWEESVRDREPGKRVSMLIVMLDDKRNAVQHH